MSVVSSIAAAEPQQAIDHFSRRLSVETDCDDVASAMKAGEQDFVLLIVFNILLFL